MVRFPWIREWAIPPAAAEYFKRAVKLHKTERSIAMDRWLAVGRAYNACRDLEEYRDSPKLLAIRLGAQLARDVGRSSAYRRNYVLMTARVAFCDDTPGRGGKSLLQILRDDAEKLGYKPSGSSDLAALCDLIAWGRKRRGLDDHLEPKRNNNSTKIIVPDGEHPFNIVHIEGDAFRALEEMNPDSVDAFMFSPPYWQQRDYAIDGQYGLESTRELYVKRFMRLLRLMQKTMKQTATAMDHHRRSSRLGR